MGNPKELICDFCGTEKKEISFIIGAATKPEWTMVYGTGKIACPDCYKVAQADADTARDRYMKDMSDPTHKLAQPS